MKELQNLRLFLGLLVWLRKARAEHSMIVKVGTAGKGIETKDLVQGYAC